MSEARYRWLARRLAGVALATIGLLAMVVGPVGAQSEEDEVRLPFGPVGIAHGQTAVLNVALLALPPNPCRVTLSFYDRAGDLLGSREEPAMAVFTLVEPNMIESLELSSALALGEGEVRVEILPAVQLPPGPCVDLAATLEVYDSNGRTSVLVHPGESRGLNPQPEPPS